jgi:hypothetical protein
MQLELISTAVLAIVTSGQAGMSLVRRGQAASNVKSARFRFTTPGHGCGDLREAVMQANVGDRLVILSRHLDEHLRSGEIVEVHGVNGAPPYVVKWADEERTALVFPGPDAHVEPAAARPGQAK